MKLEANLFPRFEATDRHNFKKYLNDIPQMERFFGEAPLGQTPVATLALADYITDDEVEVLENYQFVVTRRFTLHGELHVGGAAGEVLNVYLFISNLRRFLEEELAKETGE